jgi:hypothetical protein
MEIAVDDEAFKNAVNQYAVCDDCVKSVNGKEPDETGNVYISVGAVNSVDGIAPEADSNGNVNLNAIRTINNESPDSEGNINIALGVTSVNGISPNENGNVAIVVGVLTINNNRPDTNGNIEIDVGDGYVKSVNGELPNESGNVALNVVESVDGIAPIDGNVSFNLGSNKWVKTDSLGHLTTATTEPFVPDTAKEGYIWNNNGTIEYKDGEFVTLSTEQTITAKKTWDKGGRFNDAVEVYNSTLVVSELTASGTGTLISHGNIVLDSPNAFINIGSTSMG